MSRRSDTMAPAVSRHSARRQVFVIVAVGVAAFATRVIPYFSPGQITAVREYDDGVMLGGAIAMLAGNAPYADFFYLHPPGSLLMLLPAAASSALLGEPGAMALARMSAILVGVANTVLIAVLLRSRGAVAMLVGAGLYATWPVVVATERTILLEPVIVLGLFLALVLVRRRTTAAVVAAAVCLGLATTVKVWAIVDVAILAVAVGATMGGRMLVRYVTAAAATITAVCLPFFLFDPAGMWTQVVLAQVRRAGTQASFPTRLGTMSLAQSVHAIDLRIPWQFWLVLFVGLMIFAVLPLIQVVRKRTPVTQWSDASWWAVIIVVHSVVILLGSGYFYHYAVWLLAPLCLSVGYSAGSVARVSGRVIIVAGLAAVLGMTTMGAMRHPGEPLESPAELAEWARSGDCIWSDASRLIAADALRRNLSNNCPMDIDSFGAFLVLDSDVARSTDNFAESTVWRRRQWSFLMHADGAILPDDEVPKWFSARQSAEFERLFRTHVVLDEDGLWNRVPR